MGYRFKNAELLRSILAITLLFTPAVSCASIDTIPWEELTDKDMSPLGRAALSFDRDSWRHAETGHFVYHFIDEKMAEAVYFHAEAYYKWIKDFFGVTEDKWSRKSRVFVFTDEKMWSEFLDRARQARGPGAFTNGWELFICRKPYWLSPRYSLAHELSHVIAFRFLEGPIPLFLDEGFASFAASQLLKMQLERTDYEYHPLKLLSEEEYIPLVDAAGMTRYPGNREVFYREGEWFVRFLTFTYGHERFYEFMRAMAKGGDFKSSLEGVYGVDMDSIEKRFMSYSLSG